jgi:hypothetical protein
VTEAEFAEALSDALGSLFRVSVVDPSGATLVSFGRISGGRSVGTTIPLPHSDQSLRLELDVASIEGADRVIHGLAEPHRLEASPLGTLAHLDDALDQLISLGEASIGRSMQEMSRADKQQLVRFLDERGAFTLRKSVERVADYLGVSRFTVYNYLEASRSS